MKELALPSDTQPPQAEDQTQDAVLKDLCLLPADQLPNIFLVGAMKSGTSWLARQLELHQDVYIPGIKEPNLLMQPIGADANFDLKGPVPVETLYHQMHRFSAPTVAAYQKMYSDPEAAVSHRLDASVRYLVSDLAADRLAALHKAHNLTPRIMVMLRDPVERTWSHWQMHRSMGVEPMGIAAALDAESQRMADGWSADWAYAGYSRYADQLTRYIDRFGRDAVHVEFFENVMANRSVAMARIFDFLDLDPARADQSAQSQRVRGKIAAGSSSLEQVSQYYRPGWRKAIPKPLRKAAWHALETLNARKAKREGQREMPDTIRRRLRAEFSETVTAVETLTGTKTPWPSGDMP